MRLIHGEKKCEGCNRQTGAMLTSFQHFLLYIFTLLLIFPGILYWMFSKGKICGMCKIKYKNSKK